MIFKVLMGLKIGSGIVGFLELEWKQRIVQGKFKLNWNVPGAAKITRDFFQWES